MELLLYTTIVIVCFVQSIFGVGVLLLGTPTLLILGYSFVETLSHLLPLSLLINCLQIYNNGKIVDWNFIKLLLFFSIPSTGICLYLSLYFSFDISLILGIFMVMLALKNTTQKIEKVFSFLLKKDIAVFTFLGVIHGFTNLGGSILSMKIFILDYDKDMKRATMATAYFLLAIIQLSIIFLTQQRLKFDPTFLLLGIATFIVTEQFVFKNLSLKLFDKLFAYIILIFGLSLIIKSVI